MTSRLDPGQWTALRNLSRKQAGVEVDWINIADARALTELGLAERTRAGWTITPQGATLLEAQAEAPESDADHASIPLFGPRADPD